MSRGGAYVTYFVIGSNKTGFRLTWCVTIGRLSNDKLVVSDVEVEIDPNGAYPAYVFLSKKILEKKIIFLYFNVENKDTNKQIY